MPTARHGSFEMGEEAHQLLVLAHSLTHSHTNNVCCVMKIKGHPPPVDNQTKSYLIMMDSRSTKPELGIRIWTYARDESE